MKKLGELKGKYLEYLLSDQNIYLAIYSLQSYIFEYGLLTDEDKEIYHRLQDKFDEEYIGETIKKVKKKIEKLLEDDSEFIKAKVYFRPKKLDSEKLEDKKVIYRPMHTADIISQIAIVAMLHLFIYDIPEDNSDTPKDEKGKLYLSNLSRLIPGNFYGNRVSLKPEVLFKPWKKQYQEYTQKANEALKKYHTSLEYKYEVVLDLENFFPSIDPMLIYHFILHHLPVNLKTNDRELMKILLTKLLFARLRKQKLLKNYGMNTIKRQKKRTLNLIQKNLR